MCGKKKEKTREILRTNTFKYLPVFDLNFHSQGKADEASFMPDVIMNYSSARQI